MVEVTDAGFAEPAKAAAREVHSDLHRELGQKARQEGVPCKYRLGPRELAKVAQAMHKRMVQLNRDSQAALAEARATGWLTYRPNAQTGRLELAADQAWAKALTEGSSRMGPEFRKNRHSKVFNGVPLPMEMERAPPAELQVGIDCSHSS